LAGNAPPSSIDGVRRILLLCEQPPRLGRREAGAWLRDALAGVARADGVGDVRLVALEQAGRAPHPWEWMARIEVGDATAPEDVVASARFAELLGDLRIVGMRPEVVIDPGTAEPVRP
jgi:hypothetical protein